MARLTARPAENRLFGIALILLSTLIFSTSDAVAKFALGVVNPFELLWIRSVAVVVITVPLAYWRAGRRIFNPERPGRQIIRGSAVMMSSLCFLIGLSQIPLADNSAINFIWPILITVFSMTFLGEKVGLRRMLATAFGFVGMLMIMRPGSGAFQAAAIYPFASAILWAIASLMTRGMTSNDPPETTIVWTSLVMLIGTTLVVPFFWHPMGMKGIILGVCVGLGSAIGHALVVFAYERAEASTLAPFAYVQLVWAIMLGYLIFAAIPDSWVFAGASLIALSGLYTAHRERIRAAEKSRAVHS
jgi:drug/metabolite transporter (DMT)-like permease